MPVGSVIEIWSTDPVTKTDIGAWSGKVGHEFLGVVEGEGYDRVFVRRQKSAPMSKAGGDPSSRRRPHPQEPAR